MKLEFSVRVFLLSFIQWKFLLLPFESMPLCESCSVVFNSLRPCGQYVHGILQARRLEWVAFPFSSGSSQPRDQTQVDSLPAEPQGKPQASFFRISQNRSNFLATSFTL